MYDNEFFVVDMASCSSTGEIINSLSLALETLNHSGKKIVLKLNDNYFNQSQMLSIQSLITSYGCTLDTVETTNNETMIVAENMNILVQKPIEKRVEEKYPQKDSNGNFQPFSVDSEIKSSEIALKEVNGLHFEADLDAIQKQQENIDISRDLRNAGINPRGDFDEIDNQISSKYEIPTEQTTSSVEIFDAKESSITQSALEEIKQAIKQELEESPQESIDESNNSTNYTIGESIDNQTTNNEPNTAPTTQDYQNNKDESQDYANTEKKSIGVYKKAYDENSIEKDEWEEVDFYETAKDKSQEVIVVDSKQTTYINQTLRSGQILEAEGNVVIIGDCHPGSEIRSVGDITVWGILSGIAHAGYKGNNDAKIRALKMNAIQLRINDCYSRRPDSTNIPYIIKSSIFTPEEARIVDNEIMLFKINQN